MVETIFSYPIIREVILPFLLVFTLVFAILEKTKMLGEGKRQINAIISFVIGVILIGFAYPTGIIVKLVPFLVVCLVILFVFMLIYGFISGKKEGDVLNKGLKITLGIIFGIAVIIAVIVATGVWDNIYTALVEGQYAGEFWVSVLFLAIIGGAMTVVLATGRKKTQ